MAAIGNLEIQNVLLSEYLRDAGWTNYMGKYTTARLLLRHSPEPMQMIDELKRSLEKRWGCSLPYLQMALYSAQNMKSYIRPKINGKKRTIQLSEIKVVLDDFKLEMDKIIIDAATEGGVDFRK